MMTEIKKSVTAKELRQFGCVLGIAFSVPMLILFFAPTQALKKISVGNCQLLFVLGVVLFGLGVIRPNWLRPVHLAWMSLAWLLGQVFGRVLLFAIFISVIMPISYLMRATGRDRLWLKRLPNRSTYWLKLEPATGSYDRQF